jgi:hypothetical protein
MNQTSDSFFRFHIEHVIPRKHGGASTESNLALACHACNLHKGPNLTGIDPDTGAVVLLFNPRTQNWQDHFTEQGARVVGITSEGRATVRVLVMNDITRLQLRDASP